MRCPDCQTENVEGAAFCEMCAAPLTGYGAPVPMRASEETLRKLQKVSTRPRIVPWMAALLTATAILGPFGAVIARINAHPAVNSEGTNYIGSAFNAVGTTLAALVFIPLGIAILIAAWGVLTQRTWAWYAGAVVLAALLCGAVFGLLPGMLVRIIAAAVACASGIFWLRAGTREWYGT